MKPTVLAIYYPMDGAKNPKNPMFMAIHQIYISIYISNKSWYTNGKMCLILYYCISIIPRVELFFFRLLFFGPCEMYLWDMVAGYIVCLSF